MVAGSGLTRTASCPVRMPNSKSKVNLGTPSPSSSPRKVKGIRCQKVGCKRANAASYTPEKKRTTVNELDGRKSDKSPSVCHSSPPKKCPRRVRRESTSAVTTPRRCLTDCAPPHYGDLVESLNWRHAAAKYVFRTVSMEHYVNEYAHALASYRKVEEETLKDLADTLILRSDGPTNEEEDLADLMPPHVSGLVFNQAHLKCFDLRAILRRSPDLFRLDGERVLYRTRMTKEEAKQRLKELLVEGLFIYFFAKFTHVQRLKILVSYYEKAEPIRTALWLATGHSDMAEAIKRYFACYEGAFALVKNHLHLKVDYFNKTARDELRPFLRNQPLYEPDLEKTPAETKAVSSDYEASSPESDASLSSTPSRSNSGISGMMSDISPPPKKSSPAARRRLSFSAADTDDLPDIIKAMIEDVLLSDEDDIDDDVDCFGNPYNQVLSDVSCAIDKVVGIVHQPTNEREMEAIRAIESSFQRGMEHVASIRRRGLRAFCQ